MIKLIKSTFFNETSTKKKLCKFISEATQLSFGEQCQLFEKNFSKWQGRKEAIFVNSGSSANLAILQALLNLGRLKKGDKVGFSALTWSTNAMPLIQLGLKAVPIDIELDTLNISSQKVKETLKKHQLKAIFITNLLGFCDDIEIIEKIAENKGILMLEDNCESMGTIYRGKKLGNYSLASTFSFYVGHHMSTIEGGAVCTDDKELATMIRLVRAHGWDRNLAPKDQVFIRNKFKINSEFYSRYTFYDLGYNFRPTEINGFIGNIQLNYIDQVCAKRAENFKYFSSIINGNSEKYFPIKTNHIKFISNFAVPVVCKTTEIRDELVKKCANKIEIRPIVGGDMTRQPFFSKYMPNSYTKDFVKSNAEIAHNQGLYFANNPELTKSELKIIASVFK